MIVFESDLLLWILTKTPVCGIFEWMPIALVRKFDLLPHVNDYMKTC